MFDGIDNLHTTQQWLLQKLVVILGEETITTTWSLFKETGLLYLDPNQKWKMWGDDLNEDGTSRGPIAHSIVSGMVGVTLAAKLGLKRVRRIGIASLCHDAHKKLENDAGYVIADIAANLDIKQLFGVKVAQLARLPGHTSLDTIVRSLGDLAVITVFLSDFLVTGVEIKPVREKCSYLVAAAKAGRYPFNELGSHIWGTTFYDFLEHLVISLEASIAAILGIRPVTDLAQEISKLVYWGMPESTNT